MAPHTDQFAGRLLNARERPHGPHASAVDAQWKIELPSADGMPASRRAQHDSRTETHLGAKEAATVFENVKHCMSRLFPRRPLNALPRAKDVGTAFLVGAAYYFGAELAFWLGTERKRTEHDLRELGGRVLRAQDEERRRIARELHDGTAQNLAAIALNLQRLGELPGAATDKGQQLAQDSLDLIRQCLSEIRTLSYLLHPPLLDEIGLVAALRWYVEGFERRSGIKVDLKISPEFERLPSETEIALFRIVQEGLVNVHRHACSETAAIRLIRTDAEFVLSVSDKGKGMIDVGDISPGNEFRSLGVGIAGMRARLQQLGGQLEVMSSKRGTMVRAIVPRNRT